MTDLQKIFKIQKDFTEKIFKNIYKTDLNQLSLEEKQKYTKNYVLNITRELYEALNCIKFKDHRYYEDEFDKDNFYEEIVDVFKYLLGLMILWDLDDKKLIEEFKNKSEIVDLRFQQEILMQNYKNDDVIIIDIDGVLNDWPLPFIEFAKKNSINVNNWDEFLNLPIDIQDNLKDKYRRSGLKKSQRTNKIMIDALRSIRKKYKEIKIIILSSRPYEKYLRIFHDTKYWLDKNNIPYDAILFDNKKHRKLLMNFKKIIAFIDDDKNYIKNALSLNINSILYKNPNLQIDYYNNLYNIKNIIDPTDLYNVNYLINKIFNKK